MTIEENYQNNKFKFYNYINNIKKNIKVDINYIINVTLIKNPYITEFPKKFFLKKKEEKGTSIYFLFIKNIFKFYLKQFYLFSTYIISFIIFKVFYKKRRSMLKDFLLIDLFFLVDNIIKEKKFQENYFSTLYNVLDKKNQKYIFLSRLYGTNKNPFKLIKFFKIINQDKREFLFEFELLSFQDLMEIFIMILSYPFKTLQLIQNDELFDRELIKDIEKQSFEAFSRYIFGKNIAKLKEIDRIYSWSEFQVIERSFNYGVRSKNSNIELIACQFYLNYETYFNSYADDIDFDMYSSPHKILVNGKYYIQNRDKVIYRLGVSLRYKDIFDFKGIEKEENILLLGSYVEQDTKYMLESLNDFNNILFKNHPAVDINRFGKLGSNINVVDKNIYELFKNASLVIGTGSGTLVEAVACGLSVIIIASQGNLTANPLVKYGKGKIWDIAFNKDDIQKLYNTLLKYREENMDEIKEIASWYRDNFFVEPTEENIIKAFELEKNI